MKNSKSEKYRKYLISIIIGNTKLYTVWGTDLTDNEIDKLITNDQKVVLLFSEINRLFEYLSMHESFLFDENNFLKWLNEFKGIKPYAVFNLDKIKNLINLNFKSISRISKRNCINILNTINLIQDFSSQTSRSYILEKIESDSIKIFKDYVYIMFFWKSKHSDIDSIYKRVKPELYNQEFRNNLTIILSLFLSEIKLIH